MAKKQWLSVTWNGSQVPHVEWKEITLDILARSQQDRQCIHLEYRLSAPRWTKFTFDVEALLGAYALNPAVGSQRKMRKERYWWKWIHGLGNTLNITFGYTTERRWRSICSSCDLTPVILGRWYLDHVKSGHLVLSPHYMTPAGVEVEQSPNDST